MCIRDRDRAQKKQVLDIVTKELLTPKGLRTLSPKSGGYNPNYVGPQIQRDDAYHQGTACPWLMGFYMEAYLRIYKAVSYTHLVCANRCSGCSRTKYAAWDANWECPNS